MSKGIGMNEMSEAFKAVGVSLEKENAELKAKLEELLIDKEQWEPEWANQAEANAAGYNQAVDEINGLKAKLEECEAQAAVMRLALIHLKYCVVKKIECTNDLHCMHCECLLDADEATTTIAGVKMLKVVEAAREHLKYFIHLPPSANALALALQELDNEMP